MVEHVRVAGTDVPPGERRDVVCVASEGYTGDRTTLPIAVLHGADAGPRLFVTAAVHGDELNGIAACRELLTVVDPHALAGTLVVVPIVNVLGAQVHSRYLPDRRDLNRSFPGSASGSMAARLARLLMDEVVRDSDVGVDLHTAANRRTNVPQLRVDTSDRRSLELALAFGAPYLLDASVREGSLRDVASEVGVTVLTYEGGEALRFDAEAIEVATTGILRLMEHLGMRDGAPPAADRHPLVMRTSRWMRAERGGILELHVSPGDGVGQDQPLWTTATLLGAERSTVSSPCDAVVIGGTTLPLVSPGDAVLHLGMRDRDSTGGAGEADDLEEPADEEWADGPW